MSDLPAMKPAELRALFLDETLVHRMTSSAPPVVQQVSEHTRPDGVVYYEVELFEEPAAVIGQSLSAEMVSLIAGVTGWGASYSPRHPVRRALAEWDRTCRRRHRSTSMQWLDHLAAPICSEMLSAVVEGGASVLWCSNRWGVPYPRAERLIGTGARAIADRIEQWEQAQLGIAHDRDHCRYCLGELDKRA